MTRRRQHADKIPNLICPTFPTSATELNYLLVRASMKIWRGWVQHMKIVTKICRKLLTLSEKTPIPKEIRKRPRREIEKRKMTITVETETVHIPAEIAKGNTTKTINPDTAGTTIKMKTPDTREARTPSVTQILPRSRLVTEKQNAIF